MSDTDIHSCGYYCDRHACIVTQRNELRDKLFEKILMSERNTQTSDTKPAESSPSLWRKRQSKFEPEPMIDGWPLYSGLPQPEPVAWMHISAVGNVYFRKKPQDAVFNPQPLYTAPPKKEWVGLMEEEKTAIYKEADAGDWIDNDVLDAVEAKLKEKNT